MSAKLQACTQWIFDMDGTLTLAIHDFDAIRAQLGLPEGKPILEALSELPAERAQQLNRQLDAIELEIAHQSTAAPGAPELLGELHRRGCRLGILTRNNAANIHATLNAAGLAAYFSENSLISRDCAAPKPDPAGIHTLLARWGGKRHNAVMIGDHQFDLDSGRAAGIATVHIDRSGQFPHRHQADCCVRELDELLALI